MLVSGLLLLAVLVTAPAHAHVTLVTPPSRTTDTDLIEAPCGGKPVGPPVASYAAGTLIEVTANLTVQHKQTLQIVISHDDFATQTPLAVIPTPAAGVYTRKVSLPEEPQGSAILQVTDGTYVSCADITLSPAKAFELNSGLNDAWYFPGTAGQGFFIVVFPDTQQVFLAWFTYDSERPAADVQALLGEPGHRWITAQGSFQGNTALLDVTVTKGGVFDQAAPMPENSGPGTVGTMTVVFHDCSTGTVEYDLPGLNLVGEVPIQRIANDNVALCEALETP
jgi:hypothetical protein